MHALGVRGSRQAEILARLGELRHAGKEIGFSDIWRVSREVRTMKDANGRVIYGHLPKRTGDTTEHFLGLRF